MGLIYLNLQTELCFSAVEASMNIEQTSSRELPSS
jgi:hypothetical protein